MIEYKPASETAARKYSFPCMTVSRHGNVAVWFSEDRFVYVHYPDRSDCLGELRNTLRRLSDLLQSGDETLLPPGAQFIFTQE